MGNVNAKYYLAIDIGASGGRHIIGFLDNGKIQLEEVHRFDNGFKKVGTQLCWDLPELFHQIILGMKKCKDINKIPYSVGIDTWGVDFVLLDREDKLIGNSVAYRDNRTKGMDDKICSLISESDLYARTGIQKQIFNTIYQLMAVQLSNPEYLERAETILMIPDYLHFLLSGVKSCEYTNATTTQLVSPQTKDWDIELIDKLKFPRKIFPKLSNPGSFLGSLKKDLQEEIGYACRVVLPATHDTGSAVLAVPTSSSKPLYISSGTWSLMGTELEAADSSLGSRDRNFTNEGGYNYRFRYLKNIMGLWMIQSVKKEIGEGYNYGELCKMASEKAILSIINCNDIRFLSPESMTKEIQKACEESNQQVPNGIGEVAAVIYQSLASCYRNTVKELEEMTKHSYESIHIVGGGSNADYLNELTARATGKTVYAGPTEATAIGNILAQMIASGELKSIKEARECVMHSFEIKEYKGA